MIITKTPFRMSFFGGGTDVPSYFKYHKGCVISTTFDKYVYVTIRHLPPFFNHKSEIFYSKIEKVTAISDIEHPMIRNAMQMLNMYDLHIAYDADLPARTGLGTSSTFAVGLLNGFYALKGRFRSKNDLALDAIHLERTLCNEAGGWQDQIAASFGGFNRIDFDENGFRVTPLLISSKRKRQLNENLILFFTGYTRFSADIQTAITSKLDQNIEKYERLCELVDEAQSVLEDDSKDLDCFGHLLDLSWKIKKSTCSEISKDSIDNLYERGIKAGALGGKLLGAGGGGFLLFYVNKKYRKRVKDELKELLEVPFEFEDQGTRVIYYSPEDK